MLIYTPQPLTDRPQLYRNNKHDPGTNDPATVRELARGRRRRRLENAGQGRGCGGCLLNADYYIVYHTSRLYYQTPSTTPGNGAPHPVLDQGNNL